MRPRLYLYRYTAAFPGQSLLDSKASTTQGDAARIRRAEDAGEGADSWLGVHTLAAATNARPWAACQRVAGPVEPPMPARVERAAAAAAARRASAAQERARGALRRLDAGGRRGAAIDVVTTRGARDGLPWAARVLADSNRTFLYVYTACGGESGVTGRPASAKWCRTASRTCSGTWRCSRPCVRSSHSLKWLMRL